MIGWLAIRVGSGDTNANPDQKGALAAIAAQPFGRWLVIAMAVMFLAYALYRFAEASLDPDDAGAVERVAMLGRGIVYLAFTALAVSLASGGRSSGGSGSAPRDVTLKVLEMPAGRWLVVMGGLGVMAIGVWQGYEVLSGRFKDDLKRAEIPREVERPVLAIGAAGSLARMVTFFLVGAFLARAGWAFDPSSPVGLDESLSRVRSGTWGSLALYVVGVGLLAFGVFGLVRARYQRVMGR
jgi:hypothetical protein